MQNELFFANLLIQQTKDIVFCSDGNSKFLYVNDAACHLLKYSRQELLCMTLQELEVDFCHEVWSQQWSQLQQQGYLTLERQYRTKLGEILAVEVLVTFTTYQNQDIGCFFSKIKIKPNSETDRKVSESINLSTSDNSDNQTEQSQDFKERFLSLFCHQLRSSLNIISFSNSLLKRRLLEESKPNQACDAVQKNRSYFNNIQVEVEEINQLLDQLVFYSKLTIGHIEFQPSAIDLNWFCKEVVSRMQTIALNKQQAINLINCDDSQTAYLDPRLLQIVLTNLISNAIRYSPENSNIDFKLRSSAQLAIFEIRDYGIGIANGDRAQIFEPFYRGTNVGDVQGSGIGLAIVKNLVELQHGTIEFKSELDVGTTFTVSLPSVQLSISS